MPPEDTPEDSMTAEEYYRGMNDERAKNDCLNCGICESCIDRSIATAEEHDRLHGEQGVKTDG